MSMSMDEMIHSWRTLIRYRQMNVHTRKAACSIHAPIFFSSINSSLSGSSSSSSDEGFLPHSLMMGSWHWHTCLCNISMSMRNGEELKLGYDLFWEVWCTWRLNAHLSVIVGGRRPPAQVRMYSPSTRWRPQKQRWCREDHSWWWPKGRKGPDSLTSVSAQLSASWLYEFPSVTFHNK